MSPAGGQVDLRVLDAGDGPQRLFDAPYARGAAHAGNGQFGIALMMFHWFCPVGIAEKDAIQTEGGGACGYCGG